MKITTNLTNLGIEFSIGKDEASKQLSPASDANQEHPRRSYVYAHEDSFGKIFYIGMGVERRAWSKDRHPLWRRYVEKHLENKYHVIILRDNLSSEEAEEVEAEWISQCSDGLVNWFNMGRKTDFDTNKQYHALRDANRAQIQQAKGIEKRDLAEAAKRYLQAIEAISGYAIINSEKGLVGQLLDEETDELGRCGEIEALDRLTMCLVKLERAEEAAQHTKSYFALYRRDLQMAASQRVAKRIEKALAQAHQVKKSGAAQRSTNIVAGQETEKK